MVCSLGSNRFYKGGETKSINLINKKALKTLKNKVIRAIDPLFMKLAKSTFTTILLPFIELI
jgi:hypothetical protein